MHSEWSAAATPSGLELTSPRSARAKDIRRLAKRTFRYRRRCFLVEGVQGVGSALGDSEVLLELLATAEARTRHEELIERARTAGVPVRLVSGEVMAEIAQTVTPQGLVGICRFLDVPLERLAAARPRLVVVLAHVRDPGNAGTVLRTADAAGADGVVFTESSVDPYNSKCVRASAGSLFHLPVVLGGSPQATVAALRNGGLRVLAADGAAACSLDTAMDEGILAGATAWVFGNEAWGLSPDAVQRVDAAVRVPIRGRAESLNLATARRCACTLRPDRNRTSGPAKSTVPRMPRVSPWLGESRIESGLVGRSRQRGSEFMTAAGAEAGSW